MIDYTAYSDEELAELSRSDDKALESLIKRYKQAVISVARQYFLAGGEDEDLVQEGTIGLFKAITTYNGKTAFKNYAFACIKSRIISSVRKSTSNKNKPLNYYLPIYADDENDKNPILKLDVSDPEEEYINEDKNGFKRLRIRNIAGILPRVFLFGNSGKKKYNGKIRG